MAPTAPDTLCECVKRLSTDDTIKLIMPAEIGCYPYFDADPFIMTRTPHVYFIGNQPRFETALTIQAEGGQRTRVILIPKYSETGQVVLFNPRSLDVKVISIGTGWESMMKG